MSWWLRELIANDQTTSDFPQQRSHYGTAFLCNSTLQCAIIITKDLTRLWGHNKITLKPKIHSEMLSIRFQQCFSELLESGSFVSYSKTKGGEGMLWLSQEWAQMFWIGCANLWATCASFAHTIITIACGALVSVWIPCLIGHLHLLWQFLGGGFEPQVMVIAHISGDVSHRYLRKCLFRVWLIAKACGKGLSYTLLCELATS